MSANFLHRGANSLCIILPGFNRQLYATVAPVIFSIRRYRTEYLHPFRKSALNDTVYALSIFQWQTELILVETLAAEKVDLHHMHLLYHYCMGSMRAYVEFNLTKLSVIIPSWTKQVYVYMIVNGSTV